MIEQLWQEHYATEFPKGYGGEEIKDIDLTLLDSEAAGCILTFLQNGRKLDLCRTAILGLCYRDLAIVLQELDGKARDYFQRLETLSRFVLEAIKDKAKAG